MRNNLKDKTLKGIIWLFSATGLEAILKIIVLGILARFIGPAEFGQIGVVLIVIGFSKLLNQMGVGPAIIQKKDLSTADIYTGHFISLLFGSVLTVIFFGLSHHLAVFFNMMQLKPIFKVISVIFIIESFSLTSEALLQRDLQFKIISGISLLSFIFGYAFTGVLLAINNFGVWSLVFAIIIQTVIKSISFIVIKKHEKRLRIDVESSKKLLYFGGGFTIARFGNYLANQGDNIIVGKFLGADMLGLYGRAYQFMVMPVTLFGAALDKVLFPSMSIIQHNQKIIAKVYLKGVNLIAVVAMPMSVFLVIMSPEIVNVVLGNTWSKVVLPLQILSTSLLFRMSYRVSDSLARATGAVYKRAWIQLFYAFLVIIGSLISKKYGIEGVAWAVVFAICFNFVLLARLSLHLIDESWMNFIRAHYNGIYLSLITFIFVGGLANFLRFVGAGYFETLFYVSLLLTVFYMLLFKYFSRLIFGLEFVLITNDLAQKFKKEVKNLKHGIRNN